MSDSIFYDRIRQYVTFYQRLLNMKKDLIVLMGGQGVGKGTLAHLLMDANPNYKYIETGALFRAMPSDSEIGRLIASGQLVPDNELFKMISSNIDTDANIIMDGFPRTTAQAKWLVENYADKFNVYAIYLNVPEEIMIARIEKRIRLGGGRADDADATAVRRRLDTFWQVTMPAIEWLRTAPGIHFADVDGTGTIEENMNNLMTALQNN